MPAELLNAENDRAADPIVVLRLNVGDDMDDTKDTTAPTGVGDSERDDAPGGAPRPISKRLRSEADRAVDAVAARDDGRFSLGYVPRPFVTCGIPYKRWASPVYERRDGSFVLRLFSDPKYGLPFGEDRLVIIWLATAFAVMRQPEDNTIRFRCAKDILRAFGIPDSGHQFRRLKDRIRRIHGATFITRRRDAKSEEADRYHLIDSYRLWFDATTALNQYALWDNTIRLSDRFADDLRKAKVPIDLETVRTLKDKPGALDLYTFQLWRSFTLAASRRGEVRIPVFEPGGLVDQLGLHEGQAARKIRQLLRHWQGLISPLWPGCPNELTPDGNVLIVRAAHGLPRPGGRLCLPGVQPDPPAPKAPPPCLPVPDVGKYWEK